jgi:hypothetical protein
MYNNDYNTNHFALPRQRIPDSEKNDEWKAANVRAIVSMASGNANGGQRTSKQEKQINYDLFNGLIDEEDFQYVTDPMGIGHKYGGSQVKLENYNITKSKLELLKGEEGARPFNWTVRGVGGQVITVLEEKRRQLVLSYLQNKILSQMGLNPNEDLPEGVDTPAQIKKYMDTEYSDSREITANQVLNYVVKRDNVIRKFNEGWEHALIVAEEIYHVGIKDGHPSIRTVNPIAFEYDKDSDERYIKYAEWAREERFLHPSTVLDLYDEELDDEEKELIESGQVGGIYNQGMQTGFAYQEGVSPEHRSFINTPENGILVTHVSWRGWKEVFFLTDLDEETGQMLTSVVDSSSKLSSEQKKRGATLERKWKREIWIGTQIGSDIFVDVRPSETQDGLPYVGYIYNSTNSRATSLMDMMKPHQYAYMIVWWRLMGELAKSQGKKMPMDVASIPKSWGMDMDQWIYYFQKLDIAWYNSREEDAQKRNPLPQTFNNVDMSMSQVVQQYIMILNKLEEQVAQLTGVSPQREAQTMTSESATGVNTALVQSSYITEPLFRNHNELKKQVLTKILEVAKIAYKDGKKIAYVVDEAYVANIEIDGDTFPDSDYGLFVSDSSKDYQTKQKLEALAQVALQQDKATFRDILKMYNSQSMAEFEHYLIEAESRKMQEAQAMEKAQIESQERISANQIAAQRDIADREDARNSENNRTKLKVAEMQIANQDKDRNGVPDSAEQGKIAAQHMKIMNDAALKSNDIAVKAKKNDEDTLLKADDNRIKEKKVDNDFKEGKQERSHEKEMADKEEKMMVKEDKIKDKDFNRTIKLDDHKVEHEEKLGAAKLKTAEKGLQVEEKKLTMKMKANADKVKTAKAMPKPSAKPKPKSK